MPDNPDTPYVTLAHLLRPQGRRGELLADLLTGHPELLATAAGVYLVGPSAMAPPAQASRTHIEQQWMPTGKNAGRIVLKLAGCDTISAAERLAGSKLIIPAAERPTLDPDTFYITDLIGCTLYNGDLPAGAIVDVEFATTPDGRTRLPDAAPLLCILPTGAPPDTEPTLVPFVRAHLSSADIPNRRIFMDLPEGLLPSEP